MSAKIEQKLISLYRTIVPMVAIIMTLLFVDQWSKTSYNESVIRRLQDENLRREQAQTITLSTQPAVSLEEAPKISQQR